MSEPSVPEVEYDPFELIYRTPGAVEGDLYAVSVFPDGAEEQTLLLRVDRQVDIERLVETTAALHQTRQGLALTGEWEYDWGVAGRAQTGIWRPCWQPSDIPMELESLDDVLVVGDPPLGATRGRQRNREADFRWVYAALHGQARPASPLKRIAAMVTELSRPSIGANSWSQINFPLRDRPSVVMRLTPGLPRAAVLLDTAPQAEVACHLRVDLVYLINWLTRQLREGP